MENSVTNFEQLLNSKSARKTSIYNSKPLKQPTYRPQDVLDTVFSQIKSIQQADSVKNSKSKLTEKKSRFLVVENKPVYKEVPKLHKFETQCISDTQLINIIENVEAIDAHKGITQEFDNTFIHTHINDEITTEKIDKDEDTVSQIEQFSYTDVKEDKTSIKIEEMEETHAMTKKDSFADVFFHSHTEKDNKSMEKVNDATFTENTLNILETNKINIDMTDPKSKDMRHIFTKSHEDLGKKSVKTVVQTKIQKIIEVNIVNIDNTDKMKANFDNANVQRKINDTANAFIQGHIERDKITPTVSKTSSDESPSVLADVNVLDEQLNTENVANIYDFEQYNTEPEYKRDDLDKSDTVPEFKVNNQEKPNENLNVSKELFTEDQLPFDEGVEIEKERSPSPVLNIKPKKAKRTKTPESFSVPLDVFENFEKTVMSLVDNRDKQILINSQILENELCLNLNTHLNIDGAMLSPVIELSNDALHISKNEIEEKSNKQNILAAKSNPIVEQLNSLTQESFFNDEEIHTQDNNKGSVTKVENIKNMTEKQSESLKDEILFSSDEENERAHIEIVDLPLTCALETSFYDEPGILEKTMYVGFQTASNKSILIQTETFQKARSILSNDRECSLAELVEICDKNIDLAAQKDPVLKTELKPQLNDDRIKEASDNKEKTIEIPEKQTDFEFVGFQTANNKKNYISEKAMTKISNVFRDIDLTETFLDSEGKMKSKMPKNHELFNEDSKTDSNKNPTNIQEDNINDDLLIQEFENIEMSLEEKEVNDNKTDFEGFKTASNKKIQISDKAMLNINNIFKDIDLTELNEDVNNLIYNINEEANAYPNNSIQKTKAAENAEYINSVGDLAYPSTSKATFEGFKTANNKIIQISDIALSKTKNIFKDIDDSVIPVNDDKYYKPNNFDLNITNQRFEGLKTASNKSVSISKEAIMKSKTIFQNLEINYNFSTRKSIQNTSNIDDLRTMQPQISQKSQDNPDKDNQQNNPEIPIFEGFKTASKKPVKVSENSLAKSKLIFENINPKIDSVSDGENNNITSKDVGVFKGFQTANNKPVIVSEANLIRSRKIFAELDENNSHVDMKIDTNEKQPYLINFKAENPTFKGFTTANNKLVKISEESLAKSKMLLSEINDGTVAIETKPYAKINEVGNPVFKEFQTANKRPVNISEEALLRRKKIFQDIEPKPKENIKVDASTNNAQANSFIGFKTGNNEEVLISEAALQIHKLMFDDLKDSTLNEPNLKKNKLEFTGFQTASNKKVKISKESIEKTKSIFKDIAKDDTKRDVSQDIVAENDNNTCKIQTKTKYNIFTTASNKNITVSEEALKKSKQLLTESVYNELKPVESKQTLEESVNIETKTASTSISIDKIINTQVLHNFEDNLCTEDFQNTPKAPKRSSSPILSCPRAKKRKFETPYKPTQQITEIIEKTEPPKRITTYFEENYKKNKIVNLKDLKTVQKSIDPYITNFNYENIENFEFATERNDITNTKMILNDIKQIFLKGVDTKIIPEGWMDIHLKLIIWKLLSYEVKYNFKCTVREILNQLKYRYDKELYRAERPALRKIMEKDDVPSKTLVLCVVAIIVDGVSVQNVNTTDNIELLLTDGWYLIKALTDKMLARLVFERKIYIGRKIVTVGAELLNCEQGVSPWEDTSQNIKLKIFGNSTRPAPWDTKLGYHKSAILTHLTSVKIDGGKICKIQVFVTRVYPLLYVEKFEDGSTVTRSERLEHLHQIKYENDREAILEQIYEEVQKEFSDQESQDSESYIESGNKRKIYDTGSQIAKMMKKCKDPMEFRAQLTTSQVQLLQDHSSKNRDRMISAIQDRIKERFAGRNVVTLARGKVASVGTKGGQISVSTGMLSIWKPNDAILELFKENSWIEIMNVVPTAIRYSEVQLSAGRQSIFRQSKPKDESFAPHLEKYKRKIYKIEDLTKKPMNDNEIDTVGLIFLIDPSIEDFDSTTHFQNVYLADENKNMICINFWGGIKKFGFLNVIDTGQIISCVNLQIRAGNTRKNIPQFRVTEFTSLTKTPKNPQCREMIEDLNKKLGTDRVKFCEDCVAIQSNYSVLKCFDENSPYRINRSDYNISKNKMFIETPLRNTKKDEFNLTGLDFESTFKQTDTELSPNTLLRKKKVNERIAKLKMYGEPPPLSPINIMNKSKNASKSYKSPLICKDDSVSNLEESITMPNNVLSNRNVAESSSSSPILNKTYVKRTVNPIKLDFSKNIEQNREESESFVGDFDGSPPLSLE